MGYEIFIEKKANQKIDLNSWNKFLDSNNEFEKRDSFKATNPNSGETLEIRSPNSAVWKKGKIEVPFSYHEEYGTISVTNPDQEVINKMLEIADFLDAEVIGFEGEKYRKTSNKWWKFWKR